MQAWTRESVLALAPDASSASAGQSLASAKKWTGLGRSERALWGLCQGSGKDPYQARIDLSEPAFKCSCPSRKFPCKHGLGLLLVYAQDAKVFKDQPEPGWVTDWLATRSERAEKKAEKAQAAAEKPVDLEAQAKRAAQREARVRDGIATCRVWLDDVVRRGLAAAQSSDRGEIDAIAARMVDAQAPGLAGMIRRVPEIISLGDADGPWTQRALDQLARIHMLLTAAEKLDALPPDLGGDVRTALGWTQSKEEALAGPGVADRWVTVGQIIEEEERLRVRRTWLVGRATGRRALILDFAAGTQALDTSLVQGVEFDGELVFFPSRLPLRALIKTRAEAQAVDAPLGAAGDATCEQGLRRYAEALGANPWLARWPMVLSGARVAQQGGRWMVIDGTGAGLVLRASFAASLHLWRLVSACGFGPVMLTLEWDGASAQPLSVIDERTHAYQDLAPRWAA